MTEDWPAAGTLLAFRYRLVSRLQTGGMAEIWHATDELLARPVALKMPTTLDPARADRLQLAWREARMGARLSHPNIAAVHDYDEAVRPEGSVAPFMVMELLAGESLAARLAGAPLTWARAATVGAAVAEALTAAHSNGVVHRDIKPGNVMLTPTGVKILDFGISAVTGEPDDDETGVTFGTPAYVAPERLDGKPAEPATDVYGLGVLLYEMVTGEPPYPVDTWEELARARATGMAELPASLPPAFRDLVARCLVAEPDRRPTAAEVGEHLTALLTAGPDPSGVAVPDAARAAGNRRDLRRRRRRLLWSGLVALVVSVLAIVAALHSPRTTVDAGPVPASTPPPAGPVPSAPAPVTKTTPPAPATATRPAGSAPRRAPQPAATLDTDAALDRVRDAVEAGRSRGQIRADVAVDLLNLLQPVGRMAAGEAGDRVAEVRRKLRERVEEGSIDSARAAVLRSRLADLDTAVGAG